MAIVKFLDGTTKELNHDQSIKCWYVLNGEVEPENEAQEAFVARIKKLYLNYEAKDCPVSYIEANRQVLTEMSMMTWWRTRTGFLSAPGNPRNISDRHAYNLALRLGSWQHGRADGIAVTLQDKYVHTVPTMFAEKSE